MQLVASPAFQRVVKKLHPNQKLALDQAIQEILNSPLIGSEKRGDLSGVYIYKFKIKVQEWLLAYEIVDSEIILLLLAGPHENFYRDLKK
jgi:mRNA-degrading endonuclease RelE of RelBE toxin-antitoxin system